MARKRQAPDSNSPTKNKKTKSTADKDPNASEQSRVTFMDLPVEIRTEIYEYIFTEPMPIYLRMHNRKPGAPRQVWRYRAGPRPGKVYNRSTKKWDPAPLKHISILFASRQIFAEAEPVLYGCNVFHFHTTTGLTEFIDRVGSRAQHIRHVQFGSGSYKKSTVRSTFRALAVAKGLRTLTIAHEDACPHWVHRSHVTPSMIARDCKVLMKALQKHKQENEISGSVPDILKLRYDLPASWQQCRHEPSLAEHNERLQAEARGIISEYLGLKK